MVGVGLSLIMTVSIVTLGCKVNYTDSEEITKALIDRGYRVVRDYCQADISIVNTCVVTARADYQSRQAIRKARKVSPTAPVIVTGCAAVVGPERAEREQGVSAVVPPDQKAAVADIVGSLIGTPGESSRQPARGTRTRAFLKIQEGCDGRCSYCLVPAARGSERSIEPGEALRRIEGLVERGYKEIILVGTHLGRYGSDLNPRLFLADLLESITGPKSPARFRLSSIEPMELTDGLLAVMEKNAAITPHLHIPLQSGDDRILAEMRRPYDREAFERVILSAVGRLKDPALGVDVMVGFPGEGEREFEHTLKLIRDLPITYLHVFPFSRRPGTAAFSMEGQVSGDLKKERARILRELGRIKKEEYIKRQIGKEVSVLVEECSDGLVWGKSPNYLEVYLAGRQDDVNSFVPVILGRPFRDGVYGSRSL